MPGLPNGASLENMRKQARRLQRGVRAADPEALEILRRFGPADAAPAAEGPLATFALTAAQRVVARGYGFASWPRLVSFLTAAEPLRSDPTPVAGTPEPAADAFARWACLTWTGDDSPSHRAAAREMLSARTGLVDESIWAAAAAADPAAVVRHLDRDPRLADAHGGPHGWTPLLHLAYSRLDPAVAWDPVEAVAEHLLAGGADPNAGFLWQGLVPPFTVLTGAFGEGEQGPVNQPRHPHSLALAGLLLDAGADPNDGQTLYNRMFRPDDDHLQLLLARGLGAGTGDASPWARKLPGVLPTPADLLREQLGWAVGRGYTERVRLLLAHGTDATTDGADLVEQSLSRGDTAIVELLVAAGAPAPDLDDTGLLLAAVSRGDAAAVDALVGAEPDLAARARQRRPDLVVSVRRPAAVALLARLGFDLDVRTGGRTALHEAAFADDLPLARALVEAGADPAVEDEEHRSTPLGWARHGHCDEVVAFLETLPGAGAG